VCVACVSVRGKLTLDGAVMCIESGCLGSLYTTVVLCTVACSVVRALLQTPTRHRNTDGNVLIEQYVLYITI